MVFRSLKKTRKKCVYFVHNCLQFHFTYTPYKPSHDNHSIIPLSNHHTIIILNSHNLRNIYIHREVSIFSLARSLVERSAFETPSRRNLRGFISAVFMPLVFAAACFLLLLFHFLAFGGGREPPLASRASIPYFLFYRFNLADS